MKSFRIFKVLVVAAVSILYASCADRKTDHLLDVAEETIWTRPDSALAALESVDTLKLRTRSCQARFSLLYAMSLDRNRIDTARLSILRPAVNYYRRHGSDDDRMMVYYYLGRMYCNAGEPLRAVKCFMQAHDYSSNSSNLVFRGLVASAISDVYAMNNNLLEKVKYSEEAVGYFAAAGDSSRTWITIGRLASYYADRKDWHRTDSLYKEFFSHSPYDTAVFAEHLFNVARYSLFEPTPNPERSVDAFRKAVGEYSGKPSVSDYCAYAYALDLLGHKDAADGIFSQLETAANDSIPLMVWKYRVLKHRREFEKGLDLLERTISAQESTIVSTLSQSVSKAQSDYFEAKAELMEKDRRMRSLVDWIIVLLGVICLFVVFSVYMYSRRKWIRRMNEMSLINEDVNNRLSREHDALSDKERLLQGLRRKYVQTYKKQYSQLNDLCAEYWEASGSGKEKDRIYARVKRIVSVIDDGNQKKLERMIDENLDGIMRKLRTDLPDSTDNDFRFIALNILGFDAKNIARVMGYAVQSVYTKRVRLRSKIASLPSEHKDFYLEFID